MFEERTFEALMDRMLARVSDKFDKREGSVIYDALAPAAYELADAYVEMDIIVNEVFADSASYYYLVKRAAEKGLYPKEATHAVVKMEAVPKDAQISLNDRFNRGSLNYTVTSVMDAEGGIYQLTCETAGISGNQQLGTLLPVETENELNDLETAEITEILVPGEDEEDVDDFRERYFASFSQKAFGGNKADYTETVNEIPGIGGCKVIRSWEGGYRPADMIPGESVDAWFALQSPETAGEEAYHWLDAVYHAAKKKLLTVGGTITIPVITSEYKRPSDALVDQVQTLIDPTRNAGEGEGCAPIGHVVYVEGVSNKKIDVAVSGILCREGFSASSLQGEIEKTVDDYFAELAASWDSSDGLIARVSQIEARILMLDGIIDLGSVSLNGDSANIAMEYNEIPVRGAVSV